MSRRSFARFPPAVTWSKRLTTLTPEEEAGLVEALQAIDRGEDESAQKVRRTIGRALKC